MCERTLTMLAGSAAAMQMEASQSLANWRHYPPIPSAEERHRVAAYLQTMGYSLAEVAEFDCLSKEYELAKKAMLFSELKP